jgi:hypothetical protein
LDSQRIDTGSIFTTKDTKGTKPFFVIFVILVVVNRTGHPL